MAIVKFSVGLSRKSSLPLQKGLEILMGVGGGGGGVLKGQQITSMKQNWDL